MTLFLGFAAVNTANNLVYLIVSAALAFMAVSGLFGKRNLARIVVEVELPEEVYAQRPAPMRVTVRNRKRFLPGFLLRVVIGEQHAFFPFIEAGTESSKGLTMTFQRRGRMRIGDIRICSVFPFGFFVRCSETRNPVECIVFPEPKRCEVTAMFARNTRTRGERPAERVGYDAEPMSIRDYVRGDPLKYISWKATAKTGDLKTKEHSSLFREPVIVDIDEIPKREEEDKISCATHAVLTLFRLNIPVGLRAGKRFFAPALSGRHRRTLLQELALYGAHES